MNQVYDQQSMNQSNLANSENQSESATSFENPESDISTKKQEETTNILNKVLEQQKKSLQQVTKFNSEAQFFEKIAKIKEQFIYKYIYHDSKFYEFKELLDPNNAMFLISDDAIIYQRMHYIRLSPDSTFLNQYLPNIQIVK